MGLHQQSTSGYQLKEGGEEVVLASFAQTPFFTYVFIYFFICVYNFLLEKTKRTKKQQKKTGRAYTRVFGALRSSRAAMLVETTQEM